MSDDGKALSDVGVFVGILIDSKNKDPNSEDLAGDIDWTWFGAPGQNTLSAITQQRETIGDIVDDLVGSHDQDHTFDLDKHWRKMVVAGPAGFGVVWTAGSGDLQVGVGGKLTISSATLAAVAWLLEVAPSGQPPMSSLIGQAEIAGDLDLTATGFLDQVNVDFKLPDDKSSTLTVVGNQPSSNATKPSKQFTVEHINAWDPVRLAAFVLGQWIRQQAVDHPTSTVYQRLSRHLLPMLGDQTVENAIQPLPPFQDSGAAPDWKPWAHSIDPTQSQDPKNTQGAMTFLWHLRALLTGNDDPSFFAGSLFIPLDGSSSGSGSVPSFQPSATPLTADGLYLGATWSNNAPVSFLVRNKVGANTGDVHLFDITSSGIAAPKAPSTTGAFSDPAGRVTYDTTAQTVTLKSTDAVPITITVNLSTHNCSLTQQLPDGGSITGTVNLSTGEFSLALQLPGGPPLSFHVGADRKPSLTMGNQALTDPRQILLLVAFFITDPKSMTKQWLATLGNLNGDVGDNLTSLVRAMRGIFGTDPTFVEVGKDTPLAITLGLQATPTLDVKLSVDIHKDAGPIHVGTMTAETRLGFPLAPPSVSLDRVSLGFTDLRFNPGTTSGLASSLLPSDFLGIEGGSLTVSGPEIKVSGGGRIWIQKQLGPIDLQALDISVDNKQLSVGLDASMSLAGIDIALQDFGFRFPYETGTPKVFLRGLGLSADFSGIKLAGRFGSVNGDYIGAASVSVFDTFSLSAIGAYKMLDDGKPSLFVFAALRAPLGGPPFCFVTGIAGGFGYNRKLPPLDNIKDNAFLAIMRGDISINGDTSKLGQLDKWFGSNEGEFWIAAGIEFTSFAFINGRVLAAVAFNPFSIQLLGSAAFGIEDLAHFELEFGATVDEEKFAVVAALVDSYVIDPGLFGLQGEFALTVWHSGDHAGDFVLSIGGYHPCFPKPAWYPSVDRVEVHSVLWSFVHFSVSTFFALTPHAIMAGASVSLWGDFGVEAGLDAYVDAYLCWDPFFLLARLGVTVWFDLGMFGRHEAGVDLEIHTPKFGGHATIDLAIASFTVSFGDDDSSPPPLTIAEFFTNHLRLPTSGNADAPHIAAFSTHNRAGLWRVDVGYGRAAKLPDPRQDDTQQGLDHADPIEVAAEFGMVVRTRLPLFEVPDAALTSGTLTGVTHLPLCAIADVSGLTLSAHIDDNGKRQAANACSAAGRNFPAAQFGNEVEAVNADNQSRTQQVSSSAGSAATVFGHDTVSYEYTAAPPPSDEDVTQLQWIVSVKEESSDLATSYPLPLGGGWLGPRPPLSPTLMKQRGLAGWRGLDLRPKAQPRRGMTPMQAIAAPLARAVIEGAVPVVRSARANLALRLGLAGAQPLADGTPVVAVPAPPVRRVELQDVTLRIAPEATSRGVARLRRLGAERIARAAHPVLEPSSRRSDAGAGPYAVQTGRALVVELARGRAAQGRVQLEVAPQQVVRAVFLGAFAQVTGDVQLRASGTVAVPPRTRRLALIGEASDAPSFEPVPNRPQEPMGIEAGTLALALERHTFASHGCVARVDAGITVRIPPLSAVAGREVLSAARRIQVRFAAAVSGSVVILVSPVTRDPAPARDQVRWSSGDGTLGAMRAVTSGARVALVVQASAPGAWTLQLDVDRDYRLEAVVALAQAPAAVTTALSRSSQWTFLDHRWVPVAAAPPPNASAATATRLHLEQVK